MLSFSSFHLPCARSLFGSYTFPYDVEVSASFFSRPGIPREAIYIVPAADVVAALGRPATVGRSVSMNVIPPGTMYGDRVNQLDLLFNANAVAREQYAFQPGAGASDPWLTPLGVQPGRMVELTFQYKF